jgi:hypothetical protein
MQSPDFEVATWANCKYKLRTVHTLYSQVYSSFIGCRPRTCLVFCCRSSGSTTTSVAQQIRRPVPARPGPTTNQAV